MSKEATQTQSVEIESVHLHSACIVPGHKTEQLLNQIKTPGLQMRWNGDGVVIKGHGQEAFIPATNIKIIYTKFKK